MQHSLYAWVGFNLFVIAMLALDLGVFNRKAHEVRIREALYMSAFWIALALLFNAGIYWQLGADPALKFLTGYLVEKSLSVDNLFVFLLIFSNFKVEPRYQHKILFWGILGALVMRAIFIAAGVVLLNKFHWVIYVFGAFLVYTGFKLLAHKERELHPSENPVLKLFQRFMPFTTEYHSDHFFVQQAGKWLATPMFVVLLVVETTDVVFAVDSIPAVLAITTDPFIVYTSNVFAILGLRALYFALAGMLRMFHYLTYGLCAILVFIGSKMLISHYYKISSLLALSVIAGILALSVVFSLMKETPPDVPEPPAQPTGH